jgi:hypothetical protein
MAPIQLYYDSTPRSKGHSRIRTLQIDGESLSSRRNETAPPRIFSLQLPQTEIPGGCYGHMQLPGKPAEAAGAHRETVNGSEDP